MHIKESFYSRKWVAYWLILPSLVVIFCTLFYPIVNTVFLSLYKMDLKKPGVTPFIGFENYLRFLFDPKYWYSVSITIYFFVVSYAITFILSMFIALALNEEFKGRTFFRVLVLLPWAVPAVVCGTMWRWIYNSSFGVLNALLYQMGFIDNYQNWLGEPFRALNFVIVAQVWRESPFVSLFLLAALQTIPKELYEASKIDGAGVIKRFRFITLPLLIPSILVITILTTIWTLMVFDLIYVITGGGPAGGTKVIVYYIYENLFSYLRFGYGSALAVSLAFIIFFFTFVYIYTLRKRLH